MFLQKKIILLFKTICQDLEVQSNSNGRIVFNFPDSFFKKQTSTVCPQLSMFRLETDHSWHTLRFSLRSIFIYINSLPECLTSDNKLSADYI